MAGSQESLRKQNKKDSCFALKENNEKQKKNTHQPDQKRGNSCGTADARRVLHLRIVLRHRDRMTAKFQGKTAAAAAVVPSYFVLALSFLW